jgi:hypothetical protein
MESDDYRFAEAGDYIYQLESLISGSFSNWLCMFVPRSCNKVAHALAAEGAHVTMVSSLGLHTILCI